MGEWLMVAKYSKSSFLGLKSSLTVRARIVSQFIITEEPGDSVIFRRGFRNCTSLSALSVLPRGLSSSVLVSLSFSNSVLVSLSFSNLPTCLVLSPSSRALFPSLIKYCSYVLSASSLLITVLPAENGHVTAEFEHVTAENEHVTRSNCSIVV